MQVVAGPSGSGKLYALHASITPGMPLAALLAEADRHVFRQGPRPTWGCNNYSSGDTAPPPATTLAKRPEPHGGLHDTALPRFQGCRELQAIFSVFPGRLWFTVSLDEAGQVERVSSVSGVQS